MIHGLVIEKGFLTGIVGFLKGLTFDNEAVLNKHTVCSDSNVSSHKLNLDPTQTSFTTNYVSVGGPLDSFRDMRMVDLSQT